ncbi:diguanylate cyclase regulator RdcB family protein [Cardiobacterium hominis]|jgi:hypothetical protein|uniref:diguanylate cyclase regulator RdcB family protein n=1 Tax=Cardiobacterium hominis TaxID=2718 RepID=UPI002491AC77|nr:diguanylate cyclase regulator RdcB family protein [Cardiobacterium hominis]
MTNDDTSFQQLVADCIPFLTDKQIADTINGLSIAKELNAAQRKRHDLFTRIKDGLSGVSRKRQDDINNNLIASLEGVSAWLSEISQDIGHHAMVLHQLDQGLKKAYSNIALLTRETIAIRDNLDSLANNVSYLTKELVDLKLSVMAERQMNEMISQWEAGTLDHLSPMGKCYAVLDALYWGNFNVYIQKGNKAETASLLNTLKNKITTCLRRDLQLFDNNKDLHRDDWLALPDKQQAQELLPYLQYQGDWTWYNPRSFPVNFVATQWALLDEKEREENRRATRHMMSIEMVSEQMTHEMFKERAA